MNRTVDSKKTLLIDGSASVTVVSGSVEVFGGQAKKFGRIIIREGKRLPFYVEEKAHFEISLGANGTVAEVNGNTIPLSWTPLAEKLSIIEKKPATVMILGKSDSGKSSLCTYLLNKIVNGKKVAVLDGDMGQSDIGPPCTIAYAFSKKTATELYELKMDNAIFLGVTSPVKALAETVNGLVELNNEILRKEPDFILINTDGWVMGELAVKYKVQLIKALKPAIVVCVEREDELTPLLADLTNILTIRVEPSAYVNERSPDKRRIIREMSYVKYLEGAKVRTFLLSQVKIEEKNALPAIKGEEKNLLIAFKDSLGKFLGIGVLLEINHDRLRVLTPVSVEPAVIVIGQERLQ